MHRERGNCKLIHIASMQTQLALIIEDEGLSPFTARLKRELREWYQRTLDEERNAAALELELVRQFDREGQ